MDTNSLLGAIFGFGGGVAGGIGNSMAEQQKRQLEREKFEADRAEGALRNALLNKQMEQADTHFKATQAGQSTPYGVLFKHLGMPMPAGMDPNERIPNTLAKDVMSRMQEQDLNTRTQDFLGRAKGQPAQLMGALAPDEDPEAAAMIPRSANVPPMGRFDVGAGLAGLGHKDTGIKNLMEVLGFKEPKEPTQLNATAQVMQAAAHAQALKEQGHTPENSPELRSLIAQLNVAKIVASQAGGDIHGAGNMILGSATPPGAAGTPPAPGAPAPAGPQPLVRTPGMPSPGERAKIADTDSVIAAFTNLADMAESPEIQPMLGLKGMPGRLGEDWLKMDNLTDAQREFRARTRIELSAASKIMIGVGQTNTELARLAPALPGENDPGFAPKLRAWAAWAQQNRDDINAGLRSLNIRVPEQQNAPALPSSTAAPPAPAPKPTASTAPRASAGKGLIVTDGAKRFMWTGTMEELAAQHPGFTEWRP